MPEKEFSRISGMAHVRAAAQTYSAIRRRIVGRPRKSL
jgi:hypothetical protein